MSLEAEAQHLGGVGLQCSTLDFRGRTPPLSVLFFVCSALLSTF